MSLCWPLTQGRCPVIAFIGSAGPRSSCLGSSDPSLKGPQLVLAQHCATWANSGPAPLPGRCSTAGPWWALCTFGAEGPPGPKFCHALTAPEPESECITEPGPGGQWCASSIQGTSGRGWTHCLSVPPASRRGWAPEHARPPAAPGSSSRGRSRYSLPLPAESQSTLTPKRSPSLLQTDPELQAHTDSGQAS